jgi:hypothetical protein
VELAGGGLGADQGHGVEGVVPAGVALDAGFDERGVREGEIEAGALGASLDHRAAAEVLVGPAVGVGGDEGAAPAGGGAGGVVQVAAATQLPASR